MDSSRDSSVWRSLAVTFGGGLAIGAVGMKLSQNARRPAETVPQQPFLLPLADRLDQLEQRFQRFEQTAPAPAQPLDSKILEAVAGVIDARLSQHSDQVERRLAEFEAKVIAELETLHRQDETVSQSAAVRIQQLETQIQDRFNAIRNGVAEELKSFGDEVSHIVAEQVAAGVDARTATIQRSLEVRMSAVAQETAASAVEQHLPALRAEYEQMTRAIETQMPVLARETVAAAIEERLAPMRVEVEQKTRELAEVRTRLQESETNVLEVILAIGEICRQAASRIGGSHIPEAVAAPVPLIAEAAPSEATPVSAPEPEVIAVPELTPEPEAASTPAAMAEPAPEPAAAAVPVPAAAAEAAPLPEFPAAPVAVEVPRLSEPEREPDLAIACAPPALPQGFLDPPPDTTPLPGFAQPPKDSRVWRFPLISMVVSATAGLALLHYL